MATERGQTTRLVQYRFLGIRHNPPWPDSAHLIFALEAAGGEFSIEASIVAEWQCSRAAEFADLCHDLGQWERGELGSGTRK